MHNLLQRETIWVLLFFWLWVVVWVFFIITLLAEEIAFNMGPELPHTGERGFSHLDV